MRLFIGVPIPKGVREELEALQRRLGEGYRGWRWVRPKGLHVTLRFLGEVDPGTRLRGQGPWGAAVASVAPFEIGFSELGCFPPAGRPRLLWVGILDDPAGSLATLAERVERATRDLGFPSERRAYNPHLTLARVVRGGRAEAPPREGAGVAGRFDCSHVHLIRSELGSGGARYTELESFPLDGQREAGP